MRISGPSFHGGALAASNSQLALLLPLPPVVKLGSAIPSCWTLPLQVQRPFFAPDFAAPNSLPRPSQRRRPVCGLSPPTTTSLQPSSGAHPPACGGCPEAARDWLQCPQGHTLGGTPPTAVSAAGAFQVVDLIDKLLL